MQRVPEASRLIRTTKQVRGHRVVARTMIGTIRLTQLLHSLRVVDCVIVRVGILAVRLDIDPIEVLVRCVDQPTEKFLRVLLAIAREKTVGLAECLLELFRAKGRCGAVDVVNVTQNASIRSRDGTLVANRVVGVDLLFPFVAWGCVSRWP